MRVIFSSLAFELTKEETLARLVTEKGWSPPTQEDTRAHKDFDGVKATLRRHVGTDGDGKDTAFFEIVGPTLTDISIAYAGIICDLEDVGLLPQNS